MAADLLRQIADRQRLLDAALTKRPGGPAARVLRDLAYPLPGGQLLGYADTASECLGADSKDLSAQFVVSNVRQDRDGDVVLSQGIQLDNFARNPGWYVNHQTDEIAVGTSENPRTKQLAVVVEPARVLATCWFDPEDPDAVFLFGKVQRGYLRATSIGFLPLRAERLPARKAHADDDGPAVPGYRFTSVDLLEISIVGIPSNADALRVTAEEYRSVSPRLRKSLAAWGVSVPAWVPVQKSGTCKPGQRADITGCTPASGGAAAPAAGDKPSPDKPAGLAALARAAGHKVLSAKEATRQAAQRLGQGYWDKLPPLAQKAHAGAWRWGQVAHHVLMFTFNKGQAAADKAAKELGLSEQGATVVRRALAAVDMAMAFSVNPVAGGLVGGAVAGPAGAIAAGKAAAYVPVASLAFVAASKAVNPFLRMTAARKAAKAATAGKASKSLDPKQYESLARLVAERVANASDPDWYDALLTAALDETRGDLPAALDLADRLLEQQPSAPDAGPQGKRMKGSYFGDCERDDQGHCLPSGESGGSGSGSPPDESDDDFPQFSDAELGEVAEQEQPRFLTPLNDTDPDKVERIAESMREHGWVGPPLLAVGEQAWTGSHRLAAAQEAGLEEIPVVRADPDDVAQAAEELGYDSLDDIRDEDTMLQVLRAAGEKVGVEIMRREIGNRDRNQNQKRHSAQDNRRSRQATSSEEEPPMSKKWGKTAPKKTVRKEPAGLNTAEGSAGGFAVDDENAVQCVKCPKDKFASQDEAAAWAEKRGYSVEKATEGEDAYEFEQFPAAELAGEGEEADMDDGVKAVMGMRRKAEEPEEEEAPTPNPAAKRKVPAVRKQLPEEEEEDLDDLDLDALDAEPVDDVPAEDVPVEADLPPAEEPVEEAPIPHGAQTFQTLLELIGHAQSFAAEVLPTLEPEVVELVQECVDGLAEYANGVREKASDRYPDVDFGEVAEPEEEPAAEEPDDFLDDAVAKDVEEEPEEAKSFGLKQRMKYFRQAMAFKRLNRKCRGVVKDAADCMDDVGGRDDVPKVYRGALKYHGKALNTMLDDMEAKLEDLADLQEPEEVPAEPEQKSLAADEVDADELNALRQQVAELTGLIRRSVPARRLTA